MKNIHQFILALLIFTSFGMMTTIDAQTVKSSVCSDLSKKSSDLENIVVTICSHKTKWSQGIQPRLEFRLFSNGKAQYETESLSTQKANFGNAVLAMKEFQLNKIDFDLITKLISENDFKNAGKLYPEFQIGADFFSKTTIMMNFQDRKKQIVVKNFDSNDKDYKSYYPASLLTLLEKTADLRANDILAKVKQIEQEAINYDGFLEAGKFYRADFDSSVDRTLTLLKTPKVPFHHAVSVEWTNSKQFSISSKGTGSLVFRVISKEVKARGQNQWVTNYVCEMVIIESWQTTELDEITKKLPDAHDRTLKITELRKLNPTSGIFKTQGFVVNRYVCPSCPPKVACKPCGGNLIVISEENKFWKDYSFYNKNDLVIFTEDSKQFTEGKLYNFEIRITGKNSTDDTLNNAKLVSFKIIN